VEIIKLDNKTKNNKNFPEKILFIYGKSFYENFPEKIHF